MEAPFSINSDMISQLRFKQWLTSQNKLPLKKRIKGNLIDTKENLKHMIPQSRAIWKKQLTRYNYMGGSHAITIKWHLWGPTEKQRKS